jgi:hypothetical protein
MSPASEFKSTRRHDESGFNRRPRSITDRIEAYWRRCHISNRINPKQPRTPRVPTIHKNRNNPHPSFCRLETRFQTHQFNILVFQNSSSCELRQPFLRLQRKRHLIFYKRQYFLYIRFNGQRCVGELVFGIEMIVHYCLKIFQHMTC